LTAEHLGKVALVENTTEAICLPQRDQIGRRIPLGLVLLELPRQILVVPLLRYLLIEPPAGSSDAFGCLIPSMLKVLSTGP
jgi:hypothetical protein